MDNLIKKSRKKCMITLDLCVLEKVISWLFFEKKNLKLIKLDNHVNFGTFLTGIPTGI